MESKKGKKFYTSQDLVTERDWEKNTSHFHINECELIRVSKEQNWMILTSSEWGWKNARAKMV